MFAASTGPSAPSMFDDDDEGAGVEEDETAASDDDDFVVAKPQVRVVLHISKLFVHFSSPKPRSQSYHPRILLNAYDLGESRYGSCCQERQILR